MQTELNYDTVFDAQEHFRLLLDSMARPGKINVFPTLEIFPPGDMDQGAALTGFALLNPDATYYIAGENAEEVAEYLLVNTAAQQAEISVADYVFVPESYFGEEFYDARIGVPTYPEDSATFIINCELISANLHGDSYQITLKGPGVDGEAGVFVSGISPDLLEFVKGQNAEYPLGIDLIIVDNHNNLFCIPRSNRFESNEPKHINL